MSQIGNCNTFLIKQYPKNYDRSKAETMLLDTHSIFNLDHFKKNQQKINKHAQCT